MPVPPPKAKRPRKAPVLPLPEPKKAGPKKQEPPKKPEPKKPEPKEPEPPKPESKKPEPPKPKKPEPKKGTPKKGTPKKKEPVAVLSPLPPSRYQLTRCKTSELQKFCQERGLAFAPDDSKATLIALLRPFLK
jgi:hypothetical protein